MITFRGVFLLSSIVVISSQNYGNVCVEDSDCTFDSNSHCRMVKHCITGSCVCKPDYVYDNTGAGKCYEKGLEVGATYTTPGQCSGDFMLAGTTVCECINGFEADGKNCRFPDNTKSFGESVQYVAECSAAKYSYQQTKKGKAPFTSGEGASKDVNDKCSCFTRWANQEDKCLPDGEKPDGACAVATDCDTFNYVGVECSAASKCACPVGETNFKRWSALDYYDYYCMANDAIVDIDGGQLCGTSHSTATETACAKGLTCGQCPGASVYTCIQGASFTSVSVTLLAGSLVLLAGLTYNY